MCIRDSSLLITLIFSSFFQTSIATEIAKSYGLELPEEETGTAGLLKETSRSLLTEVIKLIWLVPLMLLLFVIGLIPVLTPFAVLTSAWLLAYGPLDIVLDVFKISALKRFKLSITHSKLLLSYGLSLTICGLIPFFAILLAPIAVAGAAWLVCEERSLLG